jgi:single-stranded DNA-binding protein
MMHVLLTGTLVKPAQSRTTAKGGAFSTALMRVPHAEANASLASLIAFADPARAAILALQPGDALSIVGEAKPTEWEKEGEIKRGLSVVVSQVLTLYQVDKRRAGK